MSRREFFRMAAAAPVALAVPAEAVPAMSHAELIAHHKRELFRLLSETVPEGTELEQAILGLSRNGRDHLHLTALKPGWTGRDAPYFCRTISSFLGDGGWEFYPGRKG